MYSKRLIDIIRSNKIMETMKVYQGIDFDKIDFEAFKSSLFIEWDAEKKQFKIVS